MSFHCNLNETLVMPPTIGKRLTYLRLKMVLHTVQNEKSFSSRCLCSVETQNNSFEYDLQVTFLVTINGY